MWLWLLPFALVLQPPQAFPDASRLWGPLFYGGPLALLHLPLPLGQLPVMLADNGLGLAVGGCKCLHIGITLRLDDGGKRIHPVADFLLCLLYLPSDVFALSGLKDTRGGGKLLLQVWQHILLQVSDARGLVPHSYHQTSHGTELCHINVQRGLRRHCPLADQPLQEGPGLAHDGPEQVREPPGLMDGLPDLLVYLSLLDLQYLRLGYVFRLLHMLGRPARFIICDGDIVEPKNLDRQNFVPADLGENKARVLAERYSTVLGMETEYVPNFIEKLPDLMELIEPKEWELHPHSSRRTKEMVLLLGCVDNNKTRQLCHQAFYQSEELIYIDSGNGKYTGQVVCGVRRNGHTMRKSIGGVHPEMLKDTDKFPSELSCAEAAQEDPQSIVANVTAATAVLIMVYNILTHGENMALQTDFSTRTIRMQTVLEKQPQTRRNAA